MPSKRKCPPARGRCRERASPRRTYAPNKWRVLTTRHRVSCLLLDRDTRLGRVVPDHVLRACAFGLCLGFVATSERRRGNHNREAQYKKRSESFHGAILLEGADA